MANNHYLKRYSEYWVNCLCAVGTSLNDSTPHLTMSEAASARTLSNIRYLVDLAEVGEIKLVMVVTLGVTTTFTAGVPGWPPWKAVSQ